MNAALSIRSLALTLALSALASASHAAGVPDRLAFRSCDEQTALVILPTIVMPPLPKGFVYTTPAGDSLLAAIHISGSTCYPANGGPAEQLVIAFALVKPPAKLTVPEIATYAIALGGYANNKKTVATFEDWGIADLIRPATVDVKLLLKSPLLGIGKVLAVGKTGSLATQMTAAGPLTDIPGGRTRAYYMPNGVLVASFDARYTTQQGAYAIGTVFQRGDGPLPPGIYGAVGSHASNYKLTVGDLEYY